MTKLPEDNSRFWALDISRGLAAFGVFIYHTHNQNLLILDGLWILVDFFFVLSGFVLAPKIWEIRSTSSFIKFAIRRIIRLLPLPILSIVFITFMQMLGLSGSNKLNFNLKDFLLAIFLLQILSMKAVLINMTLWSVSAEILSNFVIAILYRRSIYIFLGIVVLATYIFTTSTNSHKEVGLNAISRAILGVMVGIYTREKYLHRVSASKDGILRCALVLFGIIISFRIGCISPFASLFALPVFAYLTKTLAKYQSPSVPMAWWASFASRNSFGIYVWQLPVNSYIKSSFFADLFHLKTYSFVLALVTIIVKFLLILSISEVTTRFFENKVISVLRQKLKSYL